METWRVYDFICLPQQQDWENWSNKKDDLNMLERFQVKNKKKFKDQYSTGKKLEDKNIFNKINSNIL